MVTTFYNSIIGESDLLVSIISFCLANSSDSESDTTNLRQMAYEHLKSLEDSNKLIKCDDGPIAECIEQIATSHVLAVSHENQFNRARKGISIRVE